MFQFQNTEQIKITSFKKNLLNDEYFGTLFRKDESKVSTLHYDNIDSGVCIYVPKNVRVIKPVVLSSIIGKDIFGHMIIVLEEGSRMTFLEDFSFEDNKTIFQNRVVEIVVKKNAHLKYVHFRNITENITVVENIRSVVERDAQICFFHGDFGSGKLNKNITSNLVGEKSRSNINTALLGRNNGNLNLYVENKYKSVGSSGDIFTRTIGDDFSKAVIEGMICILNGVSDVKAIMQQKTLLLSDDTRVSTTPSLNIQANKVKVSHSASVSSVSDEDLFYFESRGISKEDAQKILVKGFLESVFGCVFGISEIQTLFLRYTFL